MFAQIERLKRLLIQQHLHHKQIGFLHGMGCQTKFISLCSFTKRKLTTLDHVFHQIEDNTHRLTLRVVERGRNQLIVDHRQIIPTSSGTVISIGVYVGQ